MIKVEKREGKSSKRDYTKDLCKQFKRTLSHEHFRVHFVGAWCAAYWRMPAMICLTYMWNHRDTVSSIGVTRGPSFPETISGMGHVRAFRHGLSLNERRLKFLPEYANGGSGPKENCGDVKEVWFVGSHSDM